MFTRKLGKVYGKIIWGKWVPRDVTQLKPRYLYKASENQSEWNSRINLEFHKNTISKMLFWKNRLSLNQWPLIIYDISKLAIFQWSLIPIFML